MDFNKVYLENKGWVVSIINNKIFDLPTAQELANDVFMKVHANMKTYDEKKSYGNVKVWLQAIIKNVIIDYFRHKNRDRKLDVDLFGNEKNEEIEMSSKPTYINYTDKTNPENLLIKKEVFNMVKNDLDKQSDITKKIATMYFIEGYKLKDIVVETGLELSNVKIHIHRLKKKLRFKYRKFEYGNV